MITDIPEQAHQAFIALQKGDKGKARTILQQLVEQQPDDERFWLWLSWTAQDEQERKEFLSRILAINPDNVAVRKWLAGMTPLVNALMQSSPVTYTDSSLLNASHAVALSSPSDTPTPLDAAIVSDASPAPEATVPDPDAVPVDSEDKPVTAPRSYLDVPEETGYLPMATYYAHAHYAHAHQIGPGQDDQYDEEDADNEFAARDGEEAGATESSERELYTISFAIPELNDFKQIRNLANPTLLLFGGFALVIVVFFISALHIINPPPPPPASPDSPVPVATVLPAAPVYPPDQEVPVQDMRWRLLAATVETAMLDRNTDLTTDTHILRVSIEVENRGTRPLMFRSPLLRDDLGRTFEVLADYGMLSRIAPDYQCEQQTLIPEERHTCEMLYRVPSHPARATDVNDVNGVNNLRGLMVQVDDQIPMTPNEAWIWLIAEELR